MQVFEKIITRLEQGIERNNEAILSMTSNQKGIDVALSYIDAYKIAIGIVQQEAEEYNNGWIPCSERLPDEKERERTEYDAISLAEVDVERYMASDLVNVTVKDYDKDIKFVSDDCTVNGEWTNYNYYPFEVIAWQPLPPKYEPKIKGD